MSWLNREQMFDLGVLVLGLVVSFVVMSIHHPYTSTILSMAAAVVVAVHILLVARRSSAQ